MTPDAKKVFVVHGRNGKIRSSLYSFLRAIGLEPMEWNEAIQLTGKGAPFVGEILEAAFGVAQAVVVLLTPDDEAKLRNAFIKPNDPDHERSLTGQARQNVLFEAGMAFGLHADRTILVQVGHLRPFSDISGRHVIRLDNSPISRTSLFQRLQVTGCMVTQHRTDWLEEGDFSLDDDSASTGNNESKGDGPFIEGGEIFKVFYDYLLADYAQGTTQKGRGEHILTLADIFHSFARWMIDGSLLEDQIKEKIAFHVLGTSKDSELTKLKGNRELRRVGIDDEAFRAIMVRLRALRLIEKEKGEPDSQWKLTPRGDEIMVQLTTQKKSSG